jgi:hypothetical protein
MTGEHEQLPAALAAKLEQAKLDKEATQAANATPLPGALADAFSPQQDIIVGKYKVRPFYDLDFEILQMCEHPLAKMALGGERYGEKIQDLRGASAWLVCWMMTHDVDEVDELAQQGKEAVQKAARREFSRLQLGGLLEISKAVLEQFGRYFSTVVHLVAAESDGEDAPKKKAQ